MTKRLWYALAVTAVLASALPTAARAAARASAGYSFSAIAFLGDRAPGGGFYTNDFEPSAVNSGGQVAFTADLTTGGEGVFVGSPGHLSNPARAGQPAPGGGTFDVAELGRIGLNEHGDASFAFSLQPIDFNTLGVPGGVYRCSQPCGTASAVMVPGQKAPGGGTFQGTFFNTGINDLRDMVFSGVVDNRAGIYLAPHQGSLASVVRPGDKAPGAPGSKFDSAINASINNAGDVAFGGHVKGEPCVDIGSPFACGESAYLKSATTGAIQSIAHQGELSPCGQTYQTAFGPVVNNQDAIAFIGNFGTPTGGPTGVFRWLSGTVSKVACPGDLMPGGGTMVSAGTSDGTYWMNDKGQVSFAAVLDTTTKGNNDTGVYVSSNGSTTLVARTGTVIPGIGTIVSVGESSNPSNSTGGEISNSGQVLFSATLNDGKGVVLLLATPTT